MNTVATQASTRKSVPPVQAKRAAIAKAKALAANVPAHIGSTPATRYRGNPDIFGRLVEDHDHHRALLAMIAATQGHSPERERLFVELVKEVKSHAAAEEQALWSSVMRNPETTDEARHAVAEHKELDELMADLAARDMASPGWLRRFAKLREEYLHHVGEEEQEQFLAAEEHLSENDLRHMREVFNRRKEQEKAEATIEKKLSQ
ncbi:hemerythrin domain-containing protein [Comamonas endophytica]|uniref:Hemerythrin domain-containing protein n=1 Tax=Comamonas endophytica TaxID=2949090 RepID=A0ABY6G9K3_9BURK|nr:MULTISPECIES: hemerythrin domain-containing protein [unclassified Acidovorax]MCD2514117.1 hemerythrin domain-containing protein [Acidovorax sp. D4N7]UYG51257.1 hemerythrin domain-containing protein [Acidovorax sp. 5MLIR]